MKTRKFSKNLVAAIALSASTLLVSSAWAVGQLDMNMDAIQPAGAQISYAGGASALAGVNIGVDTITGINSTPLNNNVTVACVGCILTFTSGANSGGYNWGAGGSITVVGGVDLNGGGLGAGDIPAGTTLLSGTIASAQVTGSGTTFKVAIGAFSDTKNLQLAQFYGEPGGPTNPWNGNFNLSFNDTAGTSSPNAFTSSSVLSGDIINTPGKIPEPASMLLFGIGLVGLGAWGKKRLGK